jgi:hypothetical protein
MAAKVMAMMDVVEARREMAARIFSGLETGVVHRLLIDPSLPIGTCLRYT